MERKKDHRVKYTEMIIRQSYLRLLDEKPMEKITVRELCNLAEISRGTFYSHYDDLSALLGELKAEMAREVIGVVSKMYAGENYLMDVFDDLFDYLKNNRLSCMLLLDSGSTGKGFDAIQQFSQKKIVDNWMAHSRLNRQQAERIYAYVSYGCAAVFQQWYRNGFADDPEELKQTLAGVVTKGLDGFVYAKAAN